MKGENHKLEKITNWKSILSSNIKIVDAISGSGTMGTDIVTSFSSTDFKGINLLNLADPINPQDAATKAYVDSRSPDTNISFVGSISGSGTLGTDIAKTFPLLTSKVRIYSMPLQRRPMSIHKLLILLEDRILFI